MINPVDAGKRIVDFMRGYQRKHGYSPTQREIVSATNMSGQTVNYYIKQLALANVIAHKPHAPRSAYLPGEPNQFNGGLYSGKS